MCAQTLCYKGRHHANICGVWIDKCWFPRCVISLMLHHHRLPDFALLLVSGRLFIIWGCEGVFFACIYACMHTLSCRIACLSTGVGWLDTSVCQEKAVINEQGIEFCYNPCFRDTWRTHLLKCAYNVYLNNLNIWWVVFTRQSEWREYNETWQCCKWSSPLWQFRAHLFSLFMLLSLFLILFRSILMSECDWM